MEYKQLQYFIAVTEQGSFTKAAEALYVTQPALSKQIAKLEEELGVMLFHRNTRSLQLTPAGKELYSRALVWIHDTDIMIQSVKNMDIFQRKQERIRIALADSPFSLSQSPVYDALNQFRECYHDIALNFAVVPAADFWNSFASDRMDVGISYFSQAETCPNDMEEFCFCRGQLAWGIPAGWGFTEDTAAFYEKLGEGDIYFPEDRAFWSGTITTLLNRHDCHANHIALKHYITAADLAATGTGALYAPENLLAPMRSRLGIVRISEPAAAYRISCVYPKTLEGGLIGSLLQFFPRELPPESPV